MIPLAPRTAGEDRPAIDRERAQQNTDGCRVSRRHPKAGRVKAARPDYGHWM